MLYYTKIKGDFLMPTILIVLLCIDAVLLVSLLSYVAFSLTKNVEPTVKPEVEDNVCGQETEPVQEKVAQDAVVEQEIAQPVEPVEEVAVVEDIEDDRETAKRIPFAHKMLFIDKKTQSYYDAINNNFRSMRKINPRISSKGVSYRMGRELVAKITVRGKTMKLHLALDVKAFDEKIYFQKDMSDVKSYAEVPFTVKVKSDRGLKNAIKLIDALAELKGVERKTRYTEIDSIEALKEIAKDI